MPRHARCRSFDFNPSDFLNDANVVIMNFEERGAYITLLCRAWDLSVPGVLPADEGVIRRLIGATPDEWDRVRDALKRCFDTSDGRWVQKRMHHEYEAQGARMRSPDHQSRAGLARASRSSRDGCGKFTSNTILAPAASSHSPAPPSLLPSNEEETPTPLVTAVTVGGAILLAEQIKATREKSREICAKAGELHAKARSLRREQDEAFMVYFWPVYPRKVKREASLVSFRKACLNDDDLTAILAGLEWYKREEWAERPKDKIPHATTWLNQSCWKDVREHNDQAQQRLRQETRGPEVAEKKDRDFAAC